MEPFPLPSRALSVALDAVHCCYARPKRFKSGSVGWYLSDKLDIDGVRVQVSLSVTVIGSKPKDRTEDDAVRELSIPAKASRRPAKARNGDIHGQTTLEGLNGT